MLESVRIQNFRCLRDVTLELGPFTVFVGPNASGKSAIADALTLAQVSATDRWRGTPNNPPTWAVNGKGSFQDPKQAFAISADRRKYTFILSNLRQSQQANEVWTLDSIGSHLPNLFDTLSRADQESFVSDFIRLVPMYSDIKARASGGAKRLQFEDRWQSNLWYNPEQVSDGTMLIAAFVALGFQRNVPTLAVIEDPDHGLHPYLQRHIAEMLRKLSKGELGSKPIQIVCTTHSQSFLNCLEPEEVRFIRRSRETGETEVQKAPTDNPNWQKVYDQFQTSLGSMWLTGSLGGVPGI
ncbi:AAA family ATPase [Leptothoe spongobia]|uniref:AAA family ATPase n=1 Tax=Leptothoe spongobia TAU-MAC 1115 TaxID=1967444 RepID=A0A947DGV2_9CYAN|nr:AAA family ATPase [Leptothoe spongobia]MBT9315696.1 AAA family ATPase [Leptothoe spongobia TAU-MAC 1115]